LEPGIADEQWRRAAYENFASRLGEDLQVAVVEHPDGSRLVASGAAVLLRRLPSPWNKSGHVGHIQWVATAPDMRRRGMATAVMRLLLDWCIEREASSVELHATPDGEPVYRLLGFSETGPLSMRWRPAEHG
jgi:ribosomal protein S18 acetylase RimI-like enzyme